MPKYEMLQNPNFEPTNAKEHLPGWQLVGEPSQVDRRSGRDQAARWQDLPVLAESRQRHRDDRKQLVSHAADRATRDVGLRSRRERRADDGNAARV